jgi:RsiW-degrading membrane proteinase PrsW (M82 family)
MPAGDGSEDRRWWDGSRLTDIRSPHPRDRSGWFADPAGDGWRWWSRDHWTAYRRPIGRRPRLPAWISVPIVLGALLGAAGIVRMIAQRPATLILATVPVVILLAIFLRLNEVHPTSRQARWHAFLWGALVAGVVAGFVNDAVAATWGEQAAAVGSAPIGEEILKGLVVLMAVRRGELGNRIQGAALACWVAAGFTFVEEVYYLSVAFDEGQVASVFVTRSLLTAFVHPLATVWIGVIAGLMVERARPAVYGALMGLVPAIALHAIWNAAIAADGELIFFAFVIIAVGTTFMLVAQRDRYARIHDRVAAAVVRAARTAGAAMHETALLAPFMSVAAVKAYRRGLPRASRPAFDTAYAAIAAALDTAGTRGEVTPAELASILRYARATTIGRI